jgi:hypothetical protein
MRGGGGLHVFVLDIESSLGNEGKLLLIRSCCCGGDFEESETTFVTVEPFLEMN